MLSLLTKSVVHQCSVGGIALAKLFKRKKVIICSGNENWFQEVKRPIKAKLCLTCTSCTDHSCYYAYVEFPKCYLNNSVGM